MAQINGTDLIGSEHSVHFDSILISYYCSLSITEVDAPKKARSSKDFSADEKKKVRKKDSNSIKAKRAKPIRTGNPLYPEKKSLCA